MDRKEQGTKKPVRIEAGLGNPPDDMLQIECMNAEESKVDEFAATMQEIIERQNRNISWAIIDKGLYKLHPSLNNLILPSEVWLSISNADKERYLVSVLSTDVAEKVPTVSTGNDSSGCIEEST